MLQPSKFIDIGGVYCVPNQLRQQGCKHTKPGIDYYLMKNRFSMKGLREILG